MDRNSGGSKNKMVVVHEEDRRLDSDAGTGLAVIQLEGLDRTEVLVAADGFLVRGVLKVSSQRYQSEFQVVPPGGYIDGQDPPPIDLSLDDMASGSIDVFRG